MKLTAYHRPATLADARRLLKELGPSAIPIAGATSHSFVKGDDEKIGVDLANIGYDRIAHENGRFVIGANTRIADLQNFHAPGWVLDRVALRFVSQPMRNMTTIGGNIARVFPWNDFPVALLALNATLTVTGEKETTHPADVFFKGQPSRLFQPGDLLTEVAVPEVGAGCGFGYHKETLVHMDFSRLTTAVWIRRDKKVISEARIAVGAGVPLPCRIPALESALVGKKYSAESISTCVESQLESVRWKGVDGCSDEYARQLARVHLVDVIQEAYQMAGGERS